MTLNSATLQLAQSIQNPTLTLTTKTISILTEPLALLIISITLSAFLYCKKQKSYAILLASTTITTAAIIEILKETLKIPRPSSMLVQETGYALPSGHATFAVIFFGLLVYIFAKPKYKTKAIITSTLLILTIAASRLYLQVHWATDVITGLAIGSIILTTSILIHKKFS